MPIILILVAIGVFFVFIDPKYNEVKDLQAQIERNNKTLDLAEQLREKREDLRQKYNQISDDEKLELQKMLPDTVDNVRLIIDISNIAEKYGIIIQDIQVAPEEDSEENVQVINSDFESTTSGSTINYPDTSKIGIISFSFSVVAQYDVFLDFLKDLEEALRIVDVRSITIDRVDDQSIFYNYSVKLDTYWLK